MFWLAEVFNGSISQEEMRRYEQWAHKERAETLQRLFTAAGRGLARRAKAIGSVMQSRYQRRQAARHLRGLDDHLLADIGLTRDDLYLLNRGRWPTRLADAPTPRQAAGAVTRAARGAPTEETTGGGEQDKAVGWKQAA